MKRRKTQYVLWLGGTAVACGGAFALAIAGLVPVESGMIVFGVFWLWNGLLMMLDRHPEYRKLDRWEKQAYGLALMVMGGLWTALSITPLSKEWIPCILTLLPPALIAFAGRRWYVEKKRSEQYHKNQTEKD